MLLWFYSWILGIIIGAMAVRFLEELEESEKEQRANWEDRMGPF